MADKEKNAASVGDRELGIDLGTANTVIYQKNRGIILREPSVIAVDIRTDEILAAGKDAKDMAGKTPENIMILNPIGSGAVADLSACSAMLKFFLHKSLKGLNLRKPKAMISVPSTLTDVERRAVEEAGRQAGLQSVSLFEAPMAAALGAELPIGTSKGSFIMNIGAGITETAVLSLGDIVSSAGARVGSNDIDESILTYVRRKYGLIIGLNAAENIKMKIGSAYHTDENSFTEVRGRSAVDGLPRSYTLQSDEIRGVIQPVVVRMAELVAKCLEAAPVELAADVYENGIMITGGGGGLSGIKEFITEYTGIKTSCHEDMRNCVINGTGKSLDLVISDRGVRRFRRNSL